MFVVRCSSRIPSPGISLVDDIEKAIQGKSITCFLKYFDKKYMGSNVRNFPILKMYMNDANGLSRAPLRHAQGISQILPTINATDEKSKEANIQLFSPSCKNVLDEIGSTINEGSDYAHNSSAKRRLELANVSQAENAPAMSKPGSPGAPQVVDLLVSNDDGGSVSTTTSLLAVKVEKNPDANCSFPRGSGHLLGSPVKKKEKIN